MRQSYLRGQLAPGRRGPGGERVGRGRAQSLDFDGISPYAVGDDVRAIDWRATARTRHPQVKRFLAQSHRGRMLVADLSGDLYFGTRERLMAKTVALAAGYLAWEALILHEPLGLSVPQVALVEPRRGRRHLLRLLDVLKAAYDNPAPRTNLALATSAASAQMRSGDELCVISDFAEPLEPFLAATRPLAEMRTLRAFVVEDALLRQPLQPGVYPARDSAAGRRHIFRIGARTAATAEDASAAARALQAEKLRDAGWRVHDATDLLPRKPAM